MHPGLEHIKWSELTDDDITKKIGELHRRLNIATLGGNHMIINQMHLLLDTYYNEQELRITKQYDEMIKNSDKRYTQQSIDIDWDYGKDLESKEDKN